ncbi:MAG: 3-phosphoshikimate 1-carboxyvinyltransferase [Elusimicrobia bacterium]|nr:3-phosphoshikimate 1-carboxyvinyltransferase [Elusimicrobiota bacterium]
MSRGLKGELQVPGDKSISHRALILGAMAEGHTFIDGISEGEDVRSTWRCLQSLRVRITAEAGRVTVKGSGWRGLITPKRVLDAGNSGTTMRLMMGVLAGSDLYAKLDGDESLRRRPMARVAEPLRRMGADIDLKGGKTAPVRIRGAALKGIDFASPVASAQVKSAVLLAGLLATGETSVSEPVLSRDHTERLLPMFGAKCRRDGLKFTVQGALNLAGARLFVPGDISSAAFWLIAATLAPGSELKLLNVGVNPTRTGVLDALKRMGGRVEVLPRDLPGEPSADLLVRSAKLAATDISAGEVPGLIDEVPILALAASQAEGVSRFKGLSELRHKESDRLAAIAALLKALGGSAKVEGDDLIVKGPSKLKGAKVSAGGDHRLAMTALIAGLVSEGAVKVPDADCVEISYPSFLDDLKRLGGS